MMHNKNDSFVAGVLDVQYVDRILTDAAVTVAIPEVQKVDRELVDIVAIDVVVYAILLVDNTMW